MTFAPSAHSISRLAALTTLAIVAPAMAQIASVQPYYAVVTAEKAALRAGETDQFYLVASADRGTILLVDGEGSGWARVSYPAGSTCFVKADAASVDSATNSVRLTKANRLLAASLKDGIDKSWKFVLPTALPEGSNLKLIETLKEKDGTVTGYRVAAPEAARAFTELRSVRRATAEEVASYKAKPGAYLPDGASVVAAAPALTPTKPELKPAATAEKPAATEKVDTSLVKPAVPGSTTAAPTNPVTTPDAAPAMTTPTTVTPTGGTPATTPATTPASEPAATTPGVAAGGTPPTDVPEIKPREIPAPTGPTVESLEPTFQRYWKQGGSNEEITQLIGQYEELLAKAGEDRFSQRRRAQIQSRIDVLTIKMNTQTSVSESQDNAKKVEASNLVVQQTLSQVDAARVYATVGTLTTSAVYNGTNLPLMYRVQSNDGSGRTLGYIKPSALPNLASLVGKTVGVVGDSTLDASLKLNVINAIRVDPITITPVATPVAAPAVTPAAK
jgi:uncharacterized protein YgiM (DUF1202 family)